jgi:hypothetical protein
MTSRDHARRLMLILLANDRDGLRFAQDGPTAHAAARRDDKGPERRARRVSEDGRAAELSEEAHAIANAA